jgi:hypothetical protein
LKKETITFRSNKKGIRLLLYEVSFADLLTFNLNREQERQRKRLEEITGRKAKPILNEDIEIGIRLNENKKLLHKFMHNSKSKIALYFLLKLEKTEEIDKDN